MYELIHMKAKARDWGQIQLMYNKKICLFPVTRPINILIFRSNLKVYIVFEDYKMPNNESNLWLFYDLESIS